MLRTYLWAVMVPRNNIRVDRASCAMAPYTITPDVEAMYRCATKPGVRRSPPGLHTCTRLSSLPKLNLALPLKTT
ncbi:hypothetical protein TNCV_1132811 [Trichonephila clavipes]|nr:hypothetical protein TNCV_1132811 [Trichonephila clavipes]